WLQAAVVKAVSSAESRERWPYRIPSVLGALLGVLYTFRLGQTLFDRRTGFFAAALFAPCLLLVFEAHIAKTDAFLLGVMMIAQAALARIYMSARNGADAGLPAALVFWAALGVGVLIKGPIAPVICLLTAFFTHLADRSAQLWRPLRPLIGVPLMIMIFLPWLVAIMVATDGHFAQESIGRDFFAKLMGGQELHGAPPGYYLLLMSFTFLPASLFVWPSLFFGWKYRRLGEMKFLLAWIVPYWLLIELVPTKLPHYALPLYPALAILVARAAAMIDTGLVDRLHHWLTRTYYVLWFALVFAAAAGAAAATYWLGGFWSWWAIGAAVAVAICAAFALRRAWQVRMTAALGWAIAGAVLGFAPMWQFVVPGYDKVWVSRTAYNVVRKQLSPGEPLPPVTALGFQEPSLVFYLGTNTLLGKVDEVVDYLIKQPRALAIVEARRDAAFQAELTSQGKRVRKLAEFDGINYNRGLQVRLTLYAVWAPTGPGPNR
ncbi:MAG: ArnT family glycosyltransferase, partial [Alphaproteobacteria bacterium]